MKRFCAMANLEFDFEDKYKSIQSEKCIFYPSILLFIYLCSKIFGTQESTTDIRIK